VKRLGLDYARAAQGALQGTDRLWRPRYFYVIVEKHRNDCSKFGLQRWVFLDVHTMEGHSERAKRLGHLVAEVAAGTREQAEAGSRGHGG